MATAKAKSSKKSAKSDNGIPASAEVLTLAEEIQE